MRTRRLVLRDAAPGVELRLEPSDRRHLLTVLRLRPGAELEVFDGQGNRFQAVLVSEEPPEVRIEAPLAGEADQAPHVTVALGIIKGPRMDWAVEKLSELGVRELWPLLLSRAEAHPRRERWERIALESAKQCGRARLLSIAEPLALEALAARAQDYAQRIYLDASGRREAAWSAGGGATVIVVGSEGGLAEAERRWLTDQGFEARCLTHTTLRSETAALAASALVLAGS